MKASVLDEVFNSAVEKIINGGNYLEFIVAVAVEAVKGVNSGIVIMNKPDAEKYGKILVGRVVEKLGKPDLKLILAEEFANIKGGLILRCGNIDVNCSVEAIVASVRPGLEAEAIGILFENN